MAGRPNFNAAQHPRDRFGRFTKSRTVRASAKDRSAAKAVAEAFSPNAEASGPGRAAYLRKIAGNDSSSQNLSGLPELNKALRAGDESAPGVAQLDKTMVALPDDLLLSRRVPASAFGSVDPVDLAGMKVRDAGFSPAQVGTAPAADGTVRMHIAVPAGTKAAINPSTGEIVLDRDTEMVVAKVETNSAGGHDMFLTVLPKTGSKPDGKTPAPGKEASKTDGSAAGNGADTPEGGPQVRSDLMKLKVAELQAQMRERGLKPGKKRKSELVDALVADEMGADPKLPAKRDAAPAQDPPRVTPGGLADRISEVVDELADKPGALVSLAQLRDQFGDVDRGELDAALLRLDQQRVIQLEPDPHRLGLSDRAKAAAIPLGGEDMHLVSVIKPIDDSPNFDDALPLAATGSTDALGESASGDFDARVDAAAAGTAALAAVPLSLTRAETHERVGSRQGLSAASRNALLDYQGHTYSMINGVLRGDPGPGVTNPHVPGWIDDIDSAMDRSMLPQDAVTYRGVRNARTMFGDRLDANLTGMEWREDAYLSSSADPAVTDQFVRGTDGVRMRILTPAGVGAVQVSGPVDAAGQPDESEILIARGQTLRVVADRGIGADGARDLDVEVIAHE